MDTQHYSLQFLDGKLSKYSTVLILFFVFIFNGNKYIGWDLCRPLKFVAQVRTHPLIPMSYLRK